MDKRLTTVANLIRKNSVVCDVGTDHAYLPCYLINQGISPFAYACDINEKPLQSAIQNVTNSALLDKITVMFSDGLREIECDKVDDIVIAGMGGELIFSILTAVPWTCKKNDKQYLLQPMTNVEFLRENLYKSGFDIIKEMPVIDNKHFYTVIQVSYIDITTDVDDLFLYFGKIPLSPDCDDKNEYITRVYNKIRKIHHGLTLTQDTSIIQERERLNVLIERVEKEYGQYLNTDISSRN